ncbi:unnamed protein product [Sphagnum compactum]
MPPLQRRKSEADATMEGMICQLQFLLRTCRDVIQYLAVHPAGRETVPAEVHSDLGSVIMYQKQEVLVDPGEFAARLELFSKSQVVVSTSHQIPYKSHETEDTDHEEDVNKVKYHSIVKCMLGCKQDVPFKDWNSHCLMHAMQSDEIRIQNPAKAHAKRGPQVGGSSIEGEHHQLLLLGGLKDNGLQNKTLEEIMTEELMMSQMCEQHSVHIQEEGLMCLLQQCLESEQQGAPSSIALSGYVEHFQSRDDEEDDLGWDCGWCNLQMLSSNLLAEDKEARDVLFGGVGFVPDIQSIQKWLEIAWAKGFNIAGAEYFERKVHGTHKLIGMAECATLLRSFGLRSQILEFQAAGGRKHERREGRGGKNGTNAEVTTQYKDQHHLDHQHSMTEKSAAGVDGGLGDRCKNHPGCGANEQVGNREQQKESTINHQDFINWVCDYFMNKGTNNSSKSSTPPTSFSKRSPLYFQQHRGHSLTIVGIERCPKSAPKKSDTNAADHEEDQVFFLVLDPSHKTQQIWSCLRQNSGWQSLMKLSAERLMKEAAEVLQVCYLEKGVAQGEEELESLKIVTRTVHHSH